MPSKQVFATQDPAVYTTSNGAPVSEPYGAQRAGIQGALLLQGEPICWRQVLVDLISFIDFHHIDLLAHFDRERIPERVVRAFTFDVTYPNLRHRRSMQKERVPMVISSSHTI